MGLLSFLGNALKSGAEMVSNAVTAIVDTVNDALEAVWDAAADAVGRAFEWIEDVTAPKLPPIVDSPQDLSGSIIHFRENLQKQAEESEKICINSVMTGYDNLTNYMEKNSSDPALIELLRLRRQATADSLQGVFTDYVRQRISDVNEDFFQFVAIPDKTERDRAIEKETNRILQEARKELKNQVRVSMQKLNSDLNQRIMGEISDTERQLEKRGQEYENLRKRVAKGNVDIANLENERLVIQEAALCAEDILNRHEQICAARQCAKC